MINLEELLRQRQQVPSMIGGQQGQVPTMGPISPPSQVPTFLGGQGVNMTQPGQAPISSGGVPSQLGAPQGLPAPASPLAQPGVQTNPVASQIPLPGGMPQQMPTQAQGAPNQNRWDAFFAQQGRTRPQFQRPQRPPMPAQARPGMFGGGGGGSRVGGLLNRFVSR